VVLLLATFRGRWRGHPPLKILFVGWVTLSPISKNRGICRGGSPPPFLKMPPIFRVGEG